jgi:type IV secretory pathway VirJ component
VYSESPNPAHVVLLVSGDGGWKLGVVGMAKNLANLNTLVVGIDIAHYLKVLASNADSCSYPAADFEELSKFIQKKRNFPQYETPILMGYSSGATLVYATLVQAPPGTFLGAISLGFCPDLNLKKPFCRGYGLEWSYRPKAQSYVFAPSSILKSPWVVMQGMTDKICAPDRTEKYVSQVPGASIVMLPKVGHGYAVEKNWFPEFEHAYSEFLRKMATEQNNASMTPNDLKDLPLIEMRSKQNSNTLLTMILSGDGGWANIDRQLGEHLAENGSDVIGLNSLQYFWTPRTPESASKDLERILDHYLNAWNKSGVILIGYSLGADVLPFLVNRLPAPLREKVQTIVMLGPASTADFEFHLTDWLGSFSHSDSKPVLPEVEKLKGKQMLCIGADGDTDNLCKKIGPDLAKVIETSGGHHFGGDYQSLASDILKATH